MALPGKTLQTPGGSALRPSAERRRLAILAVAQDRFLAQGYGGASMSEISAALGGSKGTLYTYFRSKAELLQDVVAWRAADLRAALLRLELPDGTGPEDRLIEAAARILTVLTAPETLVFLRLVVAEGGRFPDLARRFRETCAEAVTERMAELLSAMTAEGALHVEDPLRDAQIVVDLAIGGPLLRRLFDETLSPRRHELVRQVTPALQLYLRAHAPTAKGAI